MEKNYEIPKEDELKVIKAIGKNYSVHRLEIWRRVGRRLKPSFNYVMNHLVKIGAILEVDTDFYALHPLFSMGDPEFALRVCYPLKKKKDKNGIVVWTKK